MKPRLHNLLAAVSLLACVAAAYSWVRSYLPDDDLLYHCDGRIGVLFNDWGESRTTRTPRQSLLFVAASARTHVRVLGFEYIAGVWPMVGMGRFVVFAVPHVLVVALTAPWPAWWLAATLRRRRRCREGRGPACGYDLRATPGRCPECGADERFAGAGA